METKSTLLKLKLPALILFVVIFKYFRWVYFFTFANATVTLPMPTVARNRSAPSFEYFWSPTIFFGESLKLKVALLGLSSVKRRPIVARRSVDGRSSL